MTEKVLVVAAVVLVVVCAFIIKHNTKLRNDVDNIELFLIARDEAEKEATKQSQKKEQKTHKYSDDDEDGDTSDHFDLKTAQKLKAPPRGYTQSQNQHSSSEQHRQPKHQHHDNAQSGDDDSFGDDLHDAPLIGV